MWFSFDESLSRLSNFDGLGSNPWALYISGVRSSGHRVKPNMADNGGPNLRRLSLPTRSFIFTCIVKIAQGDWNRRNLDPPCPPYLASLFVRSVTRRSHSIYIWSSLDQTRLPNGYLPTPYPGPFARFWDKMAANFVPFRGVVARWDTRSWGSWRNRMSELNP